MKNFLGSFCLMVVGLGGLIACAHRPSLRDPNSVSSATPLLPNSTASLPNSEAITRWQDLSDYKNTSIDVTNLAQIPMKCVDTHLYPTHPQQTTKLYHVFRFASYDQSKLQAGDEACQIGSKFKNAMGKFSCLAADDGEYAVLSDTFQDSCGNLYRAVWDLAFLKQNDSMGMLFSKGRTLYQKPNSDLEDDMYVAQTYALDRKDFLFVTFLFSEDLDLIARERKNAEQTHVYDSTTHLFKPK